MKKYPRVSDSSDGRTPGLSFATVLLAFSLLLAGAGRIAAAPGNYPLYEQNYIGVVTANQQSDAIEVYLPTGAWDTAANLKWSFKPATADNWSSTEVSQWADPIDVKLRNVTAFGGLCIVASSSRYVVVAKRQAGTPDMDKVWAVDIGTGFDLQGVEMLPNGNVLVTSRTNGWVRIYQTTGTPAMGSVSLTNARAILWDPTNNIAWVSGQIGSDQVLTAYSVTYPGGTPTLTEQAAAHRSTAPSPIRDISPFVGDPSKLWVATDGAPYIYDKTAKTFTAVTGTQNRSALNSAGGHVSGYSVQLRVTGTSVNAVDFYSLNGSLVYTRTKGTAGTAAQFVRARAFNPSYEYRDAIAFGSYNIRQSGADQATIHDWEDVRRPLVIDMVRKYAFDIFGVQEAKGDQITYLADNMPEYDHVGIGRDGDQASEHAEIYYKKWRFALLGSGTFWLADGGPTTPTLGYSLQYKRLCTWARFRDLSNGKQFWVFNSHWDYNKPPDHPNYWTPSAKLILNRIALRAGDVPALFMGDLNANQSELGYSDLLMGVDDAHETADVVYDPAQCTGNKYWNVNYNDGWRVDHIFHTPGWDIKSHNVLTDNYTPGLPNGLPSDHFPVLVEAKLMPVVPQNDAIGKVVLASTSVENYGWFKAKATDANQPSISGSLGWSSAMSNATIHNESVTINLGAVRNFNMVSLFARDDGANLGSGFPANFTIDVSTNNTTWTTVATRTSYPQPSQSDGFRSPRQDLRFQTESAQYVRVTGTGIPPNAMMQFAEIEILNSYDNKAVERTVTYSSTYTGSGWSPTAVTDGTRLSYTGGMGFSSGTASAGSNHTEYITVDLGSVQPVVAVDLFPRNDASYVGHGFPVDFTIQTSSDGTSWTTRVTKTAYPQPTDGKAQGFSLSIPPGTPVNARYIKVNATSLRSNGGAFHLQFAEIEVY